MNGTTSENVKVELRPRIGTCLTPLVSFFINDSHMVVPFFSCSIRVRGRMQSKSSGKSFLPLKSFLNLFSRAFKLRLKARM